MPKLNTVYDIGAAFEAIENELISSMIRNMRRHKLEEIDEDKQWAMWQALQLKSLEKYKKDNRKKYGKQFKDINAQIKTLISLSRSEGEMAQEIAILEAIRNGFPAKRISKGATAEFFKVNDRKLETLINATMNDMQKAEIAVLRMANDQYRKVIYNAQVYANTGAGTYEKAVDMATEDFVKAGLNCVQYANGAIGGPQLESYGTKYVTLLVHWNKSQRETEKAGKALFEAVRATRNATVNHETIKFVLPVYDLQDIGVDDSGIYEMVIELAVIFEKKGNKDEE